MAARKGCRIGQKMRYLFSFCQLNGPCTRRNIYSNVSELLSKNFHFDSKTQRQMFLLRHGAIFVSHRRTQTWLLHTKLHKFGWHTSTNSARIKNSRDLILGELVYIAIIYHITDSWIFLLNGFLITWRVKTENRQWSGDSDRRASCRVRATHIWRQVKGLRRTLFHGFRSLQSDMAFEGKKIISHKS